MSERDAAPPPHALSRVPEWAERWRRSGRLVVLLDFDGTLAPIVARPELAGMPASTRAALERLRACPGVATAIVSGRGLADARERAGIPGIAYAGNHGMEIEGPGVREVHAEAAAARPALEAVLARVRPELAAIPGALAEDKGLTLSIHYRQVERAEVPRVRRIVADAVAGLEGVRTTEGKEVLEVRPKVDWHKGRAVEFLLAGLDLPAGTPALYLGDDRTDEDAFRALRAWRGGAGEGVVVAEPPPAHTSASSYLRDPAEVAVLLDELARAAPGQ